MENWNPLVGTFAILIAFAMLVVRCLQILFLYVLVVSPLFGAGYLVGGNAAVMWVNLALSPFTLILLACLLIRFFLPTYWDIWRLNVRLGGGMAHLWPVETLGAVDQRWDAFKANGVNLLRQFRARP